MGFVFEIHDKVKKQSGFSNSMSGTGLIRILVNRGLMFYFDGSEYLKDN